MKNHILPVLLGLTLALMSCNPQSAPQNEAMESNTKLKALIIDGENNHGVWPKTTMMMKDLITSLP